MRLSTWRRWRLPGAGLAAAAVLALTVGFGGQRQVQYDAQPESIAHSKEMYIFGNVDSMVATSHLVVYGTVSAVGEGRFTGADEDGTTTSQIRLRSVTIDVQDVLHNPKLALVPPSIVLEEEGWDSQGRGYIVNGVAWSQVGDAGYFFLRRAVGNPNAYELTSSDGRVLSRNGALQPSNTDRDLAGQITAIQPDMFGVKVYNASQAYAAGTLGAAGAIGDQPESVEGPGE
ncbi:hypothetical protein [Catellatospora vulcania]|uniref:hypothetical protein n=1 Tax=Catellatospora vulcania TaxID=1460450 RepID=UPI0012D37B8D|nr:hypothetical protein [Catellatospora vulcania]